MNLIITPTIRICAIKSQLLPYLLIFSLLVFSQYCFAISVDNNAEIQSTSRSSASLQALIEQAEQLRQQGYYHEALIQYQKAEQQAQLSNHKQHAVLASGLRGYLLFLMRDYAESEKLLLSALQHAVKANWSLQSAIHANHLGNVYAAQNDATKAQKFYQEARLLAQKNDDMALVARIDIASVERRQTNTWPTQNLSFINELNTHDNVTGVRSNAWLDGASRHALFPRHCYGV